MRKKRFKLTITLLILLFMFIFINDTEAYNGYNLEFGERILEFKDKGADVAILQSKLKKLSFYKGKVDGIYGRMTEDAVRRFQASQNVLVDGIVGPVTYNFFKNTELISRMEVSRSDIIQLARIIHGEARGESFTGKVAVGAVIINRVESNMFPDSIRGVILQKGQFSCLIDGQANLYPAESSINAAKAALSGYDPTYSSYYFYNPEVATNLTWIKNRPVVTRIGDHLFAR
jgi:N-acetylmuramoyl-L-alanine amidase